MFFPRNFAGFSAAFLLIVCAGCAAPSPPMPPSLNLPKPVSDLRAVRKGSKVFLAWTIPTRNTDETRTRHLGVTRVCRSLEAMHDCSNAVGEVPPPTATPKVKNTAAAVHALEASFVDELPVELMLKNPMQQINYAVSVLNRDKHAAALSNVVQIPAAPTVAPPTDLHARNTADGVLLTWTPTAGLPAIPGFKSIYRVFRRPEGTTQSSPIGNAEAGTSPGQFLDRNFEWEKPYQYTVSAVTILSQPGKPDQQVEGEDASWIDVTPHDTFPPAVPSGLEAVQSGSGQKPFIDLIWAPVGDADLAGYNVYRRENGGEPQKLNDEPVKTPAYRDATVEPTKSYSYSVSAIDLRGNESAKGTEATESIP
jgi:hypothetical protein